MERLTKIDGMGQNEMIKCFGCGEEKAGHELEHCGYCEHWQAVIDRLAAYEDTGLAPEEVQSIKDAEEQGLRVRLPCKRGDKVWRICSTKKRKFVAERTVLSVTMYEPGVFEVFTNCFDWLGKTVFLTREEAEKALEEANRNG